MLNLDTHILVKAIDGSLTLREQNVLAADLEWGISAIVLWEWAKLYQLGRLRYSPNHETAAGVIDQLQIWPLTRDVCLHLPALDFRSDPADEIIAATSLAYNVPLLTRDTKIRKSKVVPLL